MNALENPSTNGDHATAAQREVVALHEFFEAWFRGAIPDSDKSMGRLDGALSPQFQIIDPDGNMTCGRDRLLQRLRTAYAIHRDDDKPFRICIRNIESFALPDGLVLVTYEEWQEKDGQAKGRASNAVMRPDTRAPGGVEWLHVHEKWLPEKPESEARR